MENNVLEKPFWKVDDVMRLLDVSKPTAYGLMNASGCLLPIGRKKIVASESFMEYLKRGAGHNAQRNK